MRILEALLIIIAAGIAAISLYLAWQNISPAQIPYTSIIKPSSELAPLENSEVKQFYPNMRYPSSSISFSIESSCNAQKRQDMESALNIIQNKTILKFYEKINDAEIKFSCSDAVPAAKTARHFVAGEGGPVTIINTSKYSIILQGQVLLYRIERCGEPVVTIHETLHALGFDHTSHESSILYPVSNCNQQLEQEIVNTINQIYAVKPLPDITIESLNANRRGLFISFEIIIANEGLSEIGDAALILQSEGKKIKDISLESLEIGKKRIITVENLRLPWGTKDIEFIIESKEIELNKENNRAMLVAQQK